MSMTRAALLAAAAAAAQNCSRVVRVGTFDQATPYALAPATRWLDDERACFAYYRQPSGARALELLGRGDLDLAFMGSMPWSNAVARGAGVTAVSVLMDIRQSEGLVTCLNVRRLQDLRKKTLVAPYASTTHYILLATIMEAGIDINDVTVKTAEPHEIMRLWDAGEIDGAACWGECFVHLQSTPHGMQKTPGHLLVDAGTVARWGYVTFDALVANDAFLAAEPGLVSRAAEYLARANSDYTTTPDKPEWLVDGNYTATVTAFANLRDTKCTSQQIRQALRREGYPSAAAQVVDAESYALATKSQAETLFKQKAIPVDPRALPLRAFFDDAVVKPLTPTPPLLSEPPDALAITTTVLAPQRPVMDERCAPWTYAYIRGSASTYTFSDGSTGTNAYQNRVTCVWGFLASGPCVEIDVTFLRSEAPHDKLEIYSGAGLLLATLSGRTGGPIQNKIRGCVDARQPRETSEAIARTLAGDDVDLGAPVPTFAMALYARWSTDGYDEAVIGAVEPVGFAATAVRVPVGGHPCAPGYSGALCHHKFCSGVVDLSGATSGTIRSQAAGQEAYAPWSKCAWAITADAKKRVRLTFTSLDLECNYDVLRVYRGHAVPGYNVAPPPKADAKSGDFLWATTTNPDGHELLPTLLFEGDILVTFDSDAVVQNGGFELDWEVVAPDCPNQCVHGACRDDVCACDPGYYGVDCSIPNCFATARLGTALAGRITSGASLDYPPDTKCRWLVEVPSRRGFASLTGLRLKFHRLDLEPIGREAVSTDRLVTEVGGVDYDVGWSKKGGEWTSYNIRVPAIPGYTGPGVLYYKGNHATANAFGTFKQEDELTAMLPPRGDESEDDATVAVLFKFDSDASNPKAYSGFDLEFAAMYDDGRLYCDGRIENSTWPCVGDYDVCENNVCTPTTPAPARRGSKKGHSDRNTIIAIAVSAAVVGLVLCCWAGHNVYHFARRKSSLEAERAETVRAQLAAARDVVSDFQAPFATVRGDVFCGLGELLPHETLRDRGDTVVYDVAAGVERAKRDGLVFVFISHQWLGFDEPDPDGTHYEATRRALGFVCEKAGVSLDRLRIWMDIVSIPQVNRSSQRLAVASLPTFASCCQYFVVVAPDATHADTGCICDSKTFRRRAWCRAELTACWARNGSENMYYSTNSGLKPLAPNRPRDALDVFGGDLTCCAKCHPDGQPCDKELLVLPMLGLFDEIYRDRNGAKADAWAVIERRGLDKLYPKTFLWTRAADDVQTRPLFGDLIAACMASRDARAAGSKPDLRGYAPGAPGTQAVRHAHSAPPPSKRSLLRAASSRLLSPPALLRSMSTVTASSRGSSIEPTPTPAGLSPALTWHASPPSTTRPPRMVSFRHQGSGEIGDGTVSPTDTSAV